MNETIVQAEALLDLFDSHDVIQKAYKDAYSIRRKQLVAAIKEYRNRDADGEAMIGNEHIYFDKTSDGNIRVLLSRCKIHYPSGCCVAVIKPRWGTVEDHPKITEEVMNYVFAQLQHIANEVLSKAKDQCYETHSRLVQTQQHAEQTVERDAD